MPERNQKVSIMTLNVDQTTNTVNQKFLTSRDLLQMNFIVSSLGARS